MREVLTVSAVTGRGRRRAARASRSSEQRRARSVSREMFPLAVDRVFTLPASGSWRPERCCSGSVHLGDRVQISPSGLMARVRSLHAQNRPAETARAGERCALNLAGPGIDERRDPTRRRRARSRPARADRPDRRAACASLPTEKKPIGQWFPVRLHHAAAEVGARIVLLDDGPIAPGDEADVQLVLDRPIAAAAMDRFVVRDVSAQRTLGGGLFLDLRPPARKRRTPERQAQRAALAIADPSASFAALLAAPPFAADLAAFARDRALSAAQMDELASALNLVVLEAARLKDGVGPRALGALRVRRARADGGLSRRKSGPSGLGAGTAAGEARSRGCRSGRSTPPCRSLPVRTNSFWTARSSDSLRTRYRLSRGG